MFWGVFASIDNILRFVTQPLLLATVECLADVDFLGNLWVFFYSYRDA